MTIRKLHTVIGLALLLPFLSWIITAMVFYFKPGYAEAYELLQPKTYSLDGQISVSADPAWQEFRYFRTILGNHLIVRTAEGWKHLDPSTFLPKAKPTNEEIAKLLADAFFVNPQRYGSITTISNDTITTSTNVRVILNWDRLSLQQRGTDTDRIDLLYRIHYLQWTGISALDKILGPIGLSLILILSMLGIRLALGSKKVS
jgi:hypothetical protein